jgi:hypothetical protein
MIMSERDARGPENEDARLEEHAAALALMVLRTASLWLALDS